MNTNGRQMYFDAYRESTQIRAQIVSGRCAFSWKFNSIPDLQIRPFSYERVEITVQFRGIVSTLYLFLLRTSSAANSSHNMLSPPELPQLPLPFTLTKLPMQRHHKTSSEGSGAASYVRVEYQRTQAIKL